MKDGYFVSSGQYVWRWQKEKTWGGFGRESQS